MRLWSVDDVGSAPDVGRWAHSSTHGAARVPCTIGHFRGQGRSPGRHRMRGSRGPGHVLRAAKGVAVPTQRTTTSTPMSTALTTTTGMMYVAYHRISATMYSANVWSRPRPPLGSRADGDERRQNRRARWYVPIETGASSSSGRPSIGSSASQFQSLSRSVDLMMLILSPRPAPTPRCWTRE